MNLSPQEERLEKINTWRKINQIGDINKASGTLLAVIIPYRDAPNLKMGILVYAEVSHYN